MRRIKELLELFHDLQGQEYDALLQDMELWIDNEAAAKNKTKLHQQKQQRVRGKSKVRKHQVYCQTKVPLVVRQGGPSPNLELVTNLICPQ